jgi:hypothetical protein
LACVREEPRAPNCLQIFRVRVLFVKFEALSLNSRFPKARDANGPLCNFLSAAY